VIRPLLEAWRNEIESYAVEHGIPYLTDSSNLKRDYLRNRIRLDLLPFIAREYQPRFKEQILKTSVFLREEDDYIERQAEVADCSLVRDREGQLTFHFRDFQSLHPAVQWRLIRRLLDRVDPETSPEERAWDTAGSLCRRFRSDTPSFEMQVSPGVIVEKRYDKVSIRKGKPRAIPPFEAELNIPGVTRIAEIGVEIAAEEACDKTGPEDWNRSPDTGYFDYHALRFPLRVRNFRPGDRFHPLGLKGTQKLKEFYIDHKIPKIERPGIPLLVSGETIVWVIEHRISEEVKITENTKKILKLRVRSFLLTPQLSDFCT
jgi:tRNA(Ile)-lysidine synthase